ncbi:DUF4013 domain-containing protein [Candidatus Micrarchaeota archaeon]|nr:DUF4013 domain-containing protein [Candidatus Micrarchaeota archaeon]
MDIVGTIKEGFDRSIKDIVKTIVMFVGMYIPLVNFWAMGYMLDVVQTTKKKTMPDFNWVHQFIEGIKTTVILLIYIVIGVVLTMVLGIVGAMLDPMIGMVLGLIGMVLSILLTLMGFVGVMKYAMSRKFGDGFAIMAIIKRIISVDFIVTLIISILGMIPIIGPVMTATFWGKLDY